MKRIKKAVIPAAGLGVRFLPATKAQPKEMLPIVDKPAIQYIVEEVINSGIDEILIITGRNKHSIEDHFDKSLELEVRLKETGKTPCWKWSKTSAGLLMFASSGKKNRWVSAMLCTAPADLWVMNLSQCCWAMISWSMINNLA